MSKIVHESNPEFIAEGLSLPTHIQELNVSGFLAWLDKSIQVEIDDLQNGTEVIAVRTKKYRRFIRTNVGGKLIWSDNYIRKWYQTFMVESLRAPHRQRKLQISHYKRREELEFYRRHLFARNGSSCFFCNTITSMRKQTADHFIPLSRGGVDHVTNMVPSCPRCNSKKGSRLPTEEETERFAAFWDIINAHDPIPTYSPLIKLPPVNVLNASDEELSIDSDQLTKIDDSLIVAYIKGERDTPF